MPKGKDINPGKPLKRSSSKDLDATSSRFQPGTIRIIVSILILVLTIILILSIIGAGGAVGNIVYTKGFHALLGIGAVLVPVGLLVALYYIITQSRPETDWIEWTSGVIFLLAMVGLADRVSGPVHATGLLGSGIGHLFVSGFDRVGSFVVLGAIAIVSAIILLNKDLNLASVLEKVSRKKEESPEEFYEEEEPVDIPITKEEEPIVEVVNETECSCPAC